MDHLVLFFCQDLTVLLLLKSVTEFSNFVLFRTSSITIPLLYQRNFRAHLKISTKTLSGVGVGVGAAGNLFIHFGRNDIVLSITTLQNSSKFSSL